MLAGSGDGVVPRRRSQGSGIARKTRKTSPWAKQTTAPSVRKKDDGGTAELRWNHLRFRGSRSFCRTADSLAVSFA